jgi:tRNA dimethylallyltransferase
MGPTASGKTDLAIALAERGRCELISVDSAQVYRGMDVGTAKPDYPHHLVDIRDPAEVYSAAAFARDAGRLIDEIAARDRVPLLVGGTMLYFRALLEGLSPMPGADPGIRRELEAEAAQRGWPALHRRLAAVDAAAAERIHPNHSQRIGRALEVYLASGVTLTEWHQREGEGGLDRDRYRVHQIALCPVPRQLLHERIERRLAQMFDAGLVEEVAALHRRGDLNTDLPSIRAVGYRQVWGYLAGEYDLERAGELALSATRQLAKRQLTWLRGWRDLRYIYVNEQGKASKYDENPQSMSSDPLTLALNFLSGTPI